MLKLSFLSVEDEVGPEIYREIRSGLDDWLFVRKGLVELDEPDDDAGRWVTNLADWRRVVGDLVAEQDLVFCTVDLSIPEDGNGSPPDPRNGLAIVHEITARSQDGLRCCVLTGLDSSEIESVVGEAIPDVLFDFKSEAPNRYRNVVHSIKSQALSLVRSLRYFDSSGAPKTVLLEEDSGKLRDHYLSRAPYYVEKSTWHVPTLLLGPPGLGRKSFVEFLSFLAEADLRVVNLDLRSFLENRRRYEELCQLQQELGASRQGDNARRTLVYFADIDRYVPGVSGDQAENCLWPLREILTAMQGLGSTQPEGFPFTFVFSVSGDSRLRIRSAETRALIQLLEDTIGITTDFPLHHVASDVNGWPVEHPRVLAFPSIARSGRSFLERLLDLRLDELRGRLSEQVPGYRGESLTLADDVLDFLLDKMDWSGAGNYRGVASALEKSFDRFLDDRARDQFEMTRAHLPEALRTRLGRNILSMDDVRLEFPAPKGGAIEVVRKADFLVEEGELLAVVGPSGCGKSTVLRMLAGLLFPTEGTVSFRGEPITGPSSKIGFIFQDYSLFPWLTVRGNVEFGPRRRHEAPARFASRVDDLLDVAGLRGFEDAWPKQLSGGMQQRVAIIRALANEPDVLLMDEPFGALDVQTRWHMQDFLVRTKDLTGKTIVFVTHDIDEAVYIADRIYVTTPRPMTIGEEFKVPFATEIRNDHLRTDPVFVALVNRVRSALLTDIRGSRADGDKA